MTTSPVELPQAVPHADCDQSEKLADAIAESAAIYEGFGSSQHENLLLQALAYGEFEASLKECLWMQSPAPSSGRKLEISLDFGTECFWIEFQAREGREGVSFAGLDHKDRATATFIQVYPIAAECLESALVRALPDIDLQAGIAATGSRESVRLPAGALPEQRQLVVLEAPSI